MLVILAQSSTDIGSVIVAVCLLVMVGVIMVFAMNKYASV